MDFESYQQTGLYLYEALKEEPNDRLDFPCIYGGHCDTCPSHDPWDMAPFISNKSICMIPDRERKKITFILSYQRPDGTYQFMLNREKTFILPDCLHGFKWLLHFVWEVHTSALIDADDGWAGRPMADWEFRSYFPEWDKHYMCRYFLTGETEV